MLSVSVARAVQLARNPARICAFQAQIHLAAASMSASAQQAQQQAAAPELEDAIRAAKQAARQHVKSLLKLLPPEEMANESTRIAQHVLAARPFQEASCVGVYLHCARLREVDTGDLVSACLAQGKRCYVPVVEDKSSNMKLLHLDDMAGLVSVPPFGILEPTPHYADGSARQDVLQASVHLDLLLMPGLGFDETGRRLGRGGGYYDKMLSQLQQKAVVHGRQAPLLVALAYSPQVIQQVPVDAYDQGLDALVTQHGVVACSERGKLAFQ